MKPYDAAIVIKDIAKRTHGLEMTRADIESFVVHILSEKHRISLKVDKEGNMKFHISRNQEEYNPYFTAAVTLSLEEVRTLNKFSSEIIDSYDEAKKSESKEG